MTHPTPRGLIIAVEGINHIGKTSTIAGVLEALRTRGYAVQLGDELAEGIGSVVQDLLNNPHVDLTPEVIALLFATARMDAFQRVRQPLEAGVVILYDRFLWTSLVYHSVFCDPEWVAAINHHSPRADHNIVLDADPYAVVGRLDQSRIRNRYSKDLELQKKIRQSYLRLAELHPDSSTVIAANRPLGTVRNDVLKIVLDLLARRGHTLT